MASRYHGVSADTYKRMILDAGEVRANFTSLESPGLRLGATRGGSEFVIEPDMREMDVDGAPGAVMGAARMTRCSAKLTCNFVEFNEEILKLAMPGVTIYDATVIGANLKQIKRAMKLWADDSGSYLDPYSDNIVLFAEVAGTSVPLVCGVKNALATGNFELSLEDKSEAVVTVEFTAHFSPTDLASGDSTEPWIFYYPDTFVVPTTTTAPTAPTTTGEE
jgi:hypothetical protein